MRGMRIQGIRASSSTPCTRMTNEELKAALLNGEAVECRGVTYSYVSAIIYRKNDDGEMFIQVELMDRSKNSVVLTRSEEVMRLGNDEDA